MTDPQADSPAPEPVSFPARDGRVLAGLLVSAGAAPRGALVVNAATGYPCEFYLKFAGYCAERGYHALVYDYRGMGASAPAALATETACMSDWGLLDMPAALQYLATRFASLPLHTLGHSIGGWLLGCMSNQHRARAHVMIAASTGYWGRQRFPFRYLALLLWKVYGPLAIRRHGYVPQGRIWSGRSLPRGVFEQWRRWCLRPEHFAADLQGEMRDSYFNAVRAPLLHWGFDDDPIATPAAVEALLKFYPHARVERRWTAPRDVGVRRIGHQGFFFERQRDSLWRGVLDWLDALAT